VTIDGVSSDTVGLFFDKIPYIPSAKRRANTYQIPGAGEDLTIYSDDYDNIPMVLNAYIRPETDIQAVYNWIRSGSKIVLSTQPTIYGIIKAVGEIAPSRAGWDAHKIDIPLTLSPFRYLLNDEEIILSANPAYISNAGNIYSLPLYKMTGCSGDVSITVNGVQLTITDAPADIYIDTASETVYTLTNGSKESILAKTTGDFWNLTLNPGVNEIACSGTVVSVSVNIRTRWV
jgi:phage-related protein